MRMPANLMKEGICINDLFEEDEEQLIPLAGQTSMEVPLAWGRGGGRLRRRKPGGV